MSRSLDPGHGLKKASFSLIVKLTALLGLILGVTGALMFAGSVLIESMRVSAFVGFSGMFLLGGGGVLLFFSLPALLFLHLGGLLRYQAAEIVPVVEDVARRQMDLAEELVPRAARLQRQVAPDVAAAHEEVARGIARGVRQGWEEGQAAPATKNPGTP